MGWKQVGKGRGYHAMIEQSIIDEVVKIATRSAMNGHPVEKITWLPSANAAGDSDGAFAIKIL